MRWFGIGQGRSIEDRMTSELFMLVYLLCCTFGLPSLFHMGGRQAALATAVGVQS